MGKVNIANGAVVGNLLEVVTAITADYTATVDDGVINADATAATVTVTLPSAATASGQSITVRRVNGSGSNVVIDGAGSETINGATTKTLSSQYDSAVLTSNGTSWAVTTAGAGTVAPVAVTDTSATALVVGQNGATNPAFVVDTATATSATGVKVKSAAAAAGAALVVVSSGTNEALTVDAKGSGTITLNGTATGAVTTPRALVSTGATAGVGYATGAGGAVTQATNRTTGVTLSKVTGTITTHTASLAAGATAKFTVTNTAVAATDTVVLSVASATTTDQTDVKVQAVASGSFDVVVANRHASTAETGAIVINFAVVKAVAA